MGGGATGAEAGAEGTEAGAEGAETGAEGPETGPPAVILGISDIPEIGTMLTPAAAQSWRPVAMAAVAH